MGSLFRVFQVGILIYFITWVMIKEKGYQKFDHAISGVTTKVTGLAWTNLPESIVKLAGGPRIWDNGDYSIPPQQNSGFFVVTKISALIEQKLEYCAETSELRDARCRSDRDCPKGQTAGHKLNNDWDPPPQEDEIDVDLTGHGVFSGKCLKETNTCEIYAWCPIYNETESQKIPKHKIPKGLLDDLSNNDIKLTNLMNVMNTTKNNEGKDVISPFYDAKNFTVYIKNSIEFPYFRVKRCNILPKMKDEFVKECHYDENHEENKYCPRFRLGYIIEKAGANVNRLLKHGGVIAITIDWECDLDKSIDKCLPKYDFKQIDSPPEDVGYTNDSTPLRPGEGWKVEYAYHYGIKTNATDNRKRMLAVVNGIQFIVRSTGKAGKFNIINFTMNCGSVMALFGGGTIVCDLILLYVIRDKQKYREAVKDNKLVNLKTTKDKSFDNNNKIDFNDDKPRSVSISIEKIYAKTNRTKMITSKEHSRPISLISSKIDEPPAIIRNINSPKC